MMTTDGGSSADDPFDRFHVVLVEPGESLNVGSVARAMMNLGFRHLHLVAPRGYDRTRAGITARSAEPLLDSLTIHERLEDALSGMQEVVGLALPEGRHRLHHATLREWAPGLPAREGRVTALVFGPEDHGLRQEHLEQCRWVIRIPSAQEFPSFNLAQSVLLVLYEIATMFPAAPTAPPPAPGSPPPPSPAVDAPTWNDFHQLDRLLDAVMAESGFVRPGSPEPVPGVVRNLFRRLSLDRREMGILLALFSRLRTTLARRRDREE